MTDNGEHGGGGRAKPDGLVRPYVLSSGDSARKRPAQRKASESLTRDRRPTLDWTGDLASRRPREARPESTRRDAPIRPQPATEALPARRPAGNHRALQRGRHQTIWLGWPRVLAERRWLAAIGAGVAALAVAGGIVLLLSRPPSKLLANGVKAPAKTPAKAHNPIRHSPQTAPPSTARLSPTPSATPTPTPTASPTQQLAQVSYRVLRQHPNSFQGQFTIVNNGSAAINGWELVVVLPGDDIRAVSNALFHTDGDTLYIDPLRSALSLPPGATLTATFTAHGSTTALTSCSFNGSPC